MAFLYSNETMTKILFNGPFFIASPLKFTHSVSVSLFLCVSVSLSVSISCHPSLYLYLYQSLPTFSFLFHLSIANLQPTSI